ncbi:hypothetical protein V8G54_022210 [Vigna mungo]|uniref:Uncharacterized protein n=1 Tax=Vigna mungo TaxID=3915 RepID=A0AAQ3NES1_VIGMU
MTNKYGVINNDKQLINNWIILKDKTSILFFTENWIIQLKSSSVAHFFSFLQWCSSPPSSHFYSFICWIHMVVLLTPSLSGSPGIGKPCSPIFAFKSSSYFLRMCDLCS